MLYYSTLASATEPLKHLWDRIVDRGPEWIIAIALFVAAYLLGKLFGGLAQKAIGRTSTQGHVDILIGRMVNWLIVSVGLLVALSELGVSLPSLITSLGLASLGISFALQDILANLFAGVILLVQHPFTIGDQIRVDKQEGFVENVRVRDTVILTYDGERVFIPNRTVFSSPIINYSSTPALRNDVWIGIKHVEDVPRARELALQSMKEVGGVLSPPAPVVLVQYEPDHVRLVLRFWRDSDRNRGLKLISDLTETLLEALGSEGIDYMHDCPDTGAVTRPEAPQDNGATDRGKTIPMKAVFTEDRGREDQQEER